LDTCQYRTIVVTDVPRVQCAEHGVRQIAVPWAESGSRFTVLFEALVIDWLRETSVAAVARQLHLRPFRSPRFSPAGTRLAVVDRAANDDIWV
jgi:transposase